MKKIILHYTIFVFLYFISSCVHAQLQLELVNDYNKISTFSDSTPTDFTIFNNKVLFLASPENFNNRKLYSYDPSSKNLQFLTDVTNPENFVTPHKTDNGIIFIDESNGLSLWVSDGSLSGTKEIKTFSIPSNQSIQYVAKQFGNKVVFIFPNRFQIDMYITDGTNNGTKKIDSVDLVDFWKQEKKIDTDNGIIALFNDGYFYSYDENGNKQTQCEWNDEVFGVSIFKDIIYFKSSDLNTLYFCDLTTKSIGTVKEKLELTSPLRYLNVLFHNSQSIFFSYDDQTAGDGIIKYNGQNIIYNTPFDYAGYHPAKLINDHAVSIAGYFEIDTIKIKFPSTRLGNLLNIQPIPCMEGVCVVTTDSDKIPQYWYVKFGDDTAQLLLSRNKNEGITVTNNGNFGAYIDGKIILGVRHWNNGLEPGVFDISNDTISLIKDLNTNISTGNSNVGELVNLDNEFFFNVDTVDGRQFWGYDPVYNESFFIDDENYSWRDLYPVLKMRNKIYYETPNITNSNEIRCLAHNKALIFNLDTKKGHYFDCGGMPQNHVKNIFKPIDDGFIFGIDHYLAHTDPPILYDNAYTFEDYDNQTNKLSLSQISDKNQLSSNLKIDANTTTVYNHKFYYTRLNSFKSFDPRSKKHEVYNLSPENQGFNKYIGRGQRLLENGNVFDGKIVINSAFNNLTEFNISRTNIYYSNGHLLLVMNNKLYTYDVDDDILSPLEWPEFLERVGLNHSSRVYQINQENNYLFFYDSFLSDLYKYNFNTHEYTKIYDFDPMFRARFYSHYFYYIDSNNQFSRINLLDDKKEILRDSLPLNNIPSVYNDTFGNVYFFGNLDFHGSELWKLIKPNKIAGDREYIIRHDFDNQYLFPVSPDNQHAQFEILTAPKLGTIQINENGFNYIPFKDSSGPDFISYRFTNSLGLSNIGQLKLFVNKAPIAIDDFFGTVGGEFNINPGSNDIDDSKIRFRHLQIIEEPLHARVDPISFHVQKTDAFTGHDHFKYQIIDEEGDTSNIATVTIDFSTPEINTLPHASDDNFNTGINENILINILANDVDIDGDEIEYTLIELPQHGGLWDTKNGLEYRPNKDFQGVDTFRYYVTDSYGQESNLANVTIKVGVQTTTPTPNNPNNNSSNNGSSGGGSIEFLNLICLYIFMLFSSLIRKKKDKKFFKYESDIH